MIKTKLFIQLKGDYSVSFGQGTRDNLTGKYLKSMEYIRPVDNESPITDYAGAVINEYKYPIAYSCMRTVYSRTGEESYRQILDDIPTSSRQSMERVALCLEHFFDEKHRKYTTAKEHNFKVPVVGYQAFTSDTVLYTDNHAIKGEKVFEDKSDRELHDASIRVVEIATVHPYTVRKKVTYHKPIRKRIECKRWIEILKSEYAKLNDLYMPYGTCADDVLGAVQLAMIELVHYDLIHCPNDFFVHINFISRRISQLLYHQKKESPSEGSVINGMLEKRQRVFRQDISDKICQSATADILCDFIKSRLDKRTDDRCLLAFEAVIFGGYTQSQTAHFIGCKQQQVARWVLTCRSILKDNRKAVYDIIYGTYSVDDLRKAFMY